MAKSNVTHGKTPALITYIVAVVFLILGLTVPIKAALFTGGGVDFGSMPLLQFTGALKALGAIKGALPFGSELSPAFSFGVNLFGFTLDIGAIFLLLYIFITVLAAVMLLPLCAAKKNSPKPRKLIAVLESIAVAVLLPLCAISLTAAYAEWNFAVFAALGITALMLIILSIVYFRGSGVIKTITLILSAIAVLFALVNVAEHIPALGGPINGLIALLSGGRPFKTSAGLYSLNDTVYYGSTLVHTAFSSPSSLAGNLNAALVNYVALVLTVLVCLNLIVNIFVLGKSTSSFSVTANLIRYIFELLLLSTLWISVFVTLGNYGLGLYLLTLIAVVQFIIAISRFIRYKRAEELERLAEERDEDADEEDSDEDYAFDDEHAAAYPVPAEPVVETRNIVYNVNTIYNGPSDNFIKKLTNEEKVEFARVFLERNAANLSVLPDYVVGGDNSEFFTSVFIYLSRVRSVVTDGLMNKLYEEAVKVKH